MLNAIFVSGVTIFVFMSLAFIVSLIVRRNDIADFFWGIGFSVLNLVLFSIFGVQTLHLTVSVLTLLWSVRLAAHILQRLRKTSEDRRYVEMRNNFGKQFLLKSYTTVYLLQGLFMLLVSMSSIVASQFSFSSLNLFAFVGIIIWLVGFVFESVGDYQLSKFLQDHTNKGKLMTSGLWKYTRHPNYFGEVAMWWGVFIIVFSSTRQVLAVISPLTITYLLLFVSGIPLLEKKYAGRPDFERYKKQTSAFFPLPPKKI